MSKLPPPPSIESCPFCHRPMTVRNSVNPRAQCSTNNCWLHHSAISIPLDDSLQLARFNSRTPVRSDEEEIANPRCGCSSETARRVIVDHGTCSMGGCPYGGDV